ncbi:MAG TPA: GNAT family N-acetyltransferase [Thermoleophilaceae bacterium]|nr:GNAT family N-acetyltransferase [Thermoleophilaceae bacterium]
MRPQLRPAAEADRSFFLEVYASTRADELALVPWDDATKRAFVEQQFAAQESHYTRHYPGASVEVIQVDGVRAGRLFVDREELDVHIVDISLLPAFRGQGIGSALLGDLIGEAESSGRVLSIHVDAANRARSLYDRLGFELVADEGIYLKMSRAPARGAVAVSADPGYCR